MTGPQAAAATIIARGARALAGFAASDLLETRPEAAALAGNALEGWHDLMAEILASLSSALAVGRPQILAGQLRWTKTFLAARGVPEEVFRAGIASLRSTLSSDLSEGLRAAAVECLDQALEDLNLQPETPAGRLSAETPHGRLAAEYLLAILEGDGQRAFRLLSDAAQAGTAAADLCMKVLLPAQDEIGLMWMLGEANVAEEHFATATTRGVMAHLFALAPPSPANSKTLLAASVAGNQHDLGMVTVGHFFQLDGWRVIQLGADVPAVDLVEAAGFYQPDLVALSVAVPSQLPALKGAIQALRASEQGAKARILIGGRGLAEAGDLAAELGADGFAAGPSQAVALGNALVGLPAGSKKPFPS